tara:strand:+ start:300 stop:659 length:360 start_codon:yes stop_codon:yes gene_type:complete
MFNKKKGEKMTKLNPLQETVLAMKLERQAKAKVNSEESKILRINIVKDGKIETKSFMNKDELAKYLHARFNKVTSPGYNFVEKADLLYNLCVGEALIFFNHKFAINGKRRAGQVMIGGQ